ncbi:MAG: hypothetical protein IPK97_05080 [Ahniella sp.]|nr:hypothetical protein [Ahniella sp.]
MYSVSLVSLILATGALSASATEVSIKNRDTDGLVAAIHAANMSNSETTIHLAQDGLYPLVETADEEAKSALPVVQGRVTIIGHGAEIRVYSLDAFRLMSIGKNAEVKLVDLTLAEAGEGAIQNRGSLHLKGVSIIDNLSGEGFAIVENYGTLRAVDSEISFNQLAASERDAGTLVNYGDLELVRTAIESNFISRRYDSLVAASAVLNFGQVRLNGVRIRENIAQHEEEAKSLGTIVNLGNGAVSAEQVELEGNDPPESGLAL